MTHRSPDPSPSTPLASDAPANHISSQETPSKELLDRDSPVADASAKVSVVMYQPGEDDPPMLSPKEAKKKYRRSVIFLILIIIGIGVSVGMGIRRNRAYRNRHTEVLLSNVQSFFSALSSYAQGKADKTYPSYYVNGADPAAEGFLGKVKECLNPSANPAMGRGEAGSEGIIIEELQWADKNDLADEVTLIIRFDSTWAALFPHGAEGLAFRYIGGRWSYCPSVSASPAFSAKPQD